MRSTLYAACFQEATASRAGISDLFPKPSPRFAATCGHRFLLHESFIHGPPPSTHPTGPCYGHQHGAGCSMAWGAKPDTCGHLVNADDSCPNSKSGSDGLPAGRLPARCFHPGRAWRICSPPGRSLRKTKGHHEPAEAMETSGKPGPTAPDEQPSLGGLGSRTTNAPHADAGPN